MKTCFECGASAEVGHRYCDCRPERLCSPCFDPHTGECPYYGVGIRGGDPDSDLGFADDGDGGEA